MRKMLGIVAMLMVASAGVSSAGILSLDEGWNLKGTSCHIDVSTFRKEGIRILWKYENGEWEAWSPDSGIMALIDQLNIKTFSSIEPYEGFWVMAGAPIDVELCGSNDNGTEENEDRERLRSFLQNADGKTVTFFEDEEVTCNTNYNDEEDTFSITGCSDPAYNGDVTVNWSTMTLVGEDVEAKVVWADANSMCYNYRDDSGTYRTGCVVINVPQPTDDEIRASLTEDSRVPFEYDPKEDDWKPVGICITYNDNGTVIYTDENGDVVSSCNYEVDNGSVGVTCDTDNGTIVKKAKAISPFSLPEENATGSIVNIGFYAPDGTLKGWRNVISVKVEECEEFWREYNRDQ